MISQDWCYNKRKVPAGAAAPVVWVERQENNMHISYKPLWHTLLERDMRKEDLRLAAGMTTNMIANMSKEGKHISEKSADCFDPASLVGKAVGRRRKFCG